MPALVLVLFLLLPLAEIAVFVRIGGVLGIIPTLALVLLSAFGGLAIIRAQGLATLRRVRVALDCGELPAADLFDGACLVMAGVLLIVPGFITDSIALLVLLPPVRTALRRRLGGWLVGRRADRHPPMVVIEGEFTEMDDDGGQPLGAARRHGASLRLRHECDRRRA